MPALPLPSRITVETTASCQLKCPACPTPFDLGRPRGFFTTKLFTHLLSQISWPLEDVSFGWSGEPLLNRELPSLIALARTTGATTYVSTNGLLLERDAKRLVDAKLDVLRVCIDGVDQAMATKYRVGTDFDRVIRGTEQTIAARQAVGATTPFVSMQMLVTRDTERSLDEFAALAQRCGVDEVYFKSFNITFSHCLDDQARQALAEQFLPENADFLRYQRNESGKWVLRPDIMNSPCPEVGEAVTILHTGDVVPCCEDFAGKHVLGNIRRQSLAEIWQGSEYAQLRGRVARRGLDMCEQCTYPGASALNRVVPLRPATAT